MQKQDIETILASQRKFFATGKTLPISWRLEQLKKLRASMLRHEEDLYGALKKDLGKSWDLVRLPGLIRQIIKYTLLRK